MSESQAIQSIMNAELEVYRQKGRVLELEANNAALRLKVQEYNSALDAMTARYVVLEKLVKAIPPANNPYELVAIIEHGNETAYNNVAALLTRRQSMQ